MNVRIASLLFALLLGGAILVSAQDAPKKAVPKKDVGLKATTKKAPARKRGRKTELDDQQQGISSRYKKFEKKLLQLAQFLRENDPERAELLRRAYGQSRDDNISNSLERIASLLDGQKRLGDAVGAQTEVVVNLQSLLILLQSDDLKDSIEKEKERIKDLLKNLRTVIGKHKRARTANERGDAADRVAGRQSDAAKKARDLIKKIDGQDEDSRNKDGKGKDGKGKDGKSQQGQQSKQDDDKTPGRDEIERAQREMERAIEELKKKSRDAAADHQDKALKDLLVAKEKLEEILRQLREEERKLLLAALEARFQKMLAMQLAVFQGTITLGQVSADAWVGRHTTQSIKLARDEEEIAVEAIKALTLLKEEGSSVAFPEAVIELREDMLVVSRRLEESKVGKLTRAIEKDIIESLEEMIDALQKELEKTEDEKKEQEQKKQQQQQQDQEPPLVDKLAELKMLRALQLRVNRRTRRLARLIDGEQAKDNDVIQQLKDLARRQARVQKAARDLATGRNR